MAYLSVFTGAILTILGILTFLWTGSDSPTALIPVGFGILYLVFGFLGKKENFRKISMYSTFGISLLGSAGTFRVFSELKRILDNEQAESLIAVFAQLTMFILCSIFLILSLRAIYDQLFSTDSE